MYLLEPAVITILLFHQDAPIPTALWPDPWLEHPFMGPCKAKLSRHSYNTSPGSWEIFVYGSQNVKNKDYKGQAVLKPLAGAILSWER